jgi:hypothetical protein
MCYDVGIGECFMKKVSLFALILSILTNLGALVMEVYFGYVLFVVAALSSIGSGTMSASAVLLLAVAAAVLLFTAVTVVLGCVGIGVRQKRGAKKLFVVFVVFEALLCALMLAVGIYAAVNSNIMLTICGFAIAVLKLIGVVVIIKDLKSYSAVEKVEISKV